MSSLFRALLTAALAFGGATAQADVVPVVMEVAPSLPTHTIYHPAEMTSGKPRLPIVAWANGGCQNAGNMFRPFLSAIASHRYLVIAIGPIGDASVEQTPKPSQRAAPPKSAGDPAAPPPKTHWQQLGEAIDWAIAENGRAGGPFAGKLDTKHIAVMGQSCGGLQALAQSVADPRVTTSVIWNSGVLGETAGLPGAEVTKADLSKLHAPIAYISGDQSDVAFPNADDDFARISTVPVLRAWMQGVGHSGTYREPDGGSFAPVAVAWLEWQLKGDARAKRFFLPSRECGLCRTPGWTVRAKQMPR